MKTLLIMRHAKSSWEDEDLDDIERPLNDRGRKDAPLMGEVLQRFKTAPGVAVCSPAVRTRQTLDGMLDNWEETPLVRWEDGFYYGGVEDYVQAVANLPDNMDIGLLLGHNPLVESVMRKLCGADVKMKTASVAAIEWEINRWSTVVEGNGVLQWLIAPKLVKKACS